MVTFRAQSGQQNSEDKLGMEVEAAYFLLIEVTTPSMQNIVVRKRSWRSG